MMKKDNRKDRSLGAVLRFFVTVLYMSILNRLILFFYTLFLALLALGLIVLCFGVVPFDFIENNILYLLHRPETIFGAGIFFLISIELLFSVFSSKRERNMGSEGIIVQGEKGSVKIAKTAVLDFVQRICEQEPGISNTQIKIKFMQDKKSEEEFTDLSIKAEMRKDYNVVGIADELREKVTHDLDKFMGIKKINVDIVVDAVSKNENRKRVV